MGSEGQNSPNQTSGTEGKRPWEVFPEAEISAIEKKKKQLDRHERKRLRREKYKTKLINLKQLAKTHKIIFTIFAIIFLSIFLIGVFLGIIQPIGTHILGQTVSEQQTIDGSEEFEAEEDSEDNKPPEYTIKTAPTPEIAYESAMAILKPILAKGILDTEAVNFSKLEDNYNAFSKTIETEYEKICYYLAMIDSMFAFESDFGSARAAYLLERFDEKKMNLDKTQYYFYLEVRISYANYKKDDAAVETYLAERNAKYPPEDSYIDSETGEIIKDKELLKEIKDGFSNAGNDNA